jgi:hypothetical protein
LLALRRPADRKAWKRTIVTAGVVAFIIFFLRHANLLHALEVGWLDLMALIDRPSLRAPVTVVVIDDDDYHDPALFAALSPLHPDVLERMVRTVAAHRPRGVVLDVQIQPDLSDVAGRGAGRLRLYHTLDSLARAGPTRWVLVRDLESETHTSGVSDTLRRTWDWLTTNPSIAWADPGVERPGGIARAIARYQQQPGTEVLRPTVLGSAVEAFGLTPLRSAPRWDIEDRPEQPWRIRFTRRFVDDTAHVSPVRLTASALLESPPLAGQRTILTDRIAVVGGTYREGRDNCLTPVGEMPGVCFWAEAIASWIRHDALREPPPHIVLLLEFLVGVLTGYFLLRAGPGLGMLLSIIVVLPLTVGFSLLAFGDRVLFVNFLPAFVGVYLHYQIELHFLLRHQSHAIAELTFKLRAANRRLARARQPARGASATPPDATTSAPEI